MKQVSLFHFRAAEILCLGGFEFQCFRSCDLGVRTFLKPPPPPPNKKEKALSCSTTTCSGTSVPGYFTLVNARKLRAFVIRLA